MRFLFPKKETPTPDPSKDAFSKLLTQVKHLELKSKKRATSLEGGLYASAFKGQGMVFDEVRRYFPGDDVRKIDWNVTARTHKPHIKQFKEERQRHVLLVVDVSRSTLYGSGKSTKRGTAAEVAGLLAASALHHGDQVGLALFAGELEKWVSFSGAPTQVQRILREVLVTNPKSPNPKDLSNVLQKIPHVVKKPTLLFLISDFYGPSFLKPLKKLNQKHDCVALSIKDPWEKNLPKNGLMAFIDQETSQKVWVDTWSNDVRASYFEHNQNLKKGLQSNFKEAGVDYLPLTVGQDVFRPIRSFLKKRKSV